jgi:AraC-like DNA-binding protein
MSTAVDPNWESFSDAVTDAYFPHRLTVRRTPRQPATTLRAVDLGPVRLARIGWGSDVSVESDHPGAWAVNVPRSGVLEARVGERHVLSVDGQATVCPPDVRTRMTHWSADCSIVGMRIDRDYLSQEVATLVGGSSTAMPAQIDLHGGAGLTWLTLLSTIGSEVLHRPELREDRTVAMRLGATLTAALVLACYPESDEHGGLQPRIVSRVLDALEDDPARAWTASDLAVVAGVGIRRLQQGFREYHGRTPMAVLQDIRLERAHADLLGGEAATVADVAYRWGFGHLGRFAAAYRERYGVAPSHTLRG